MSPSKVLFGSLIMVLGSGRPAQAADATSNQRLAGQYGRTALVLVAAQTALSVRALDTAIVLATEAAAIDPSPAAWRLMLRLADLAERPEMRRTALAELVNLDPDDEVIRLLLINDAIERYHTAEERINVYETLLDQRNRARLGPAVASRLAMDYALLLDRCGDVDGFSRWLAEAVAIDPSNRTAAATAAGFFRINAPDAYTEAELLRTLLLADPTDPDAQTVLAELLLEHGAYSGAARLYRLAKRTHEARKDGVSSGLVADGVVARWATGDAAGALDILEKFQRNFDERYRRTLRRDNPELSSLELARRHAPMAGTLATVRTAILNCIGDEQAGPALGSALAAYDAEIEAIKTAETVDRSQVASRSLEAAWVALWLGDDIERATAFLETAIEHLGDDGLSRTARARFDGWSALRQDDPTTAVTHLSPVAQQDPAARLGLALARRALGERRAAARDLYAVFTEQPGTLMAVWAKVQLSEMVGQPIGAGETAARLESLVATIPLVIDRFPDDPTLMVSLRVIPVKTTYEPHEPVMLNVEVTNNAPVPLAIDRNGPIPPHVLLDISAQIARSPAADIMRPIIVELDRRLRLEPGERLVVPVDLRQGSLGQVLNMMPLQGVTMKVRGIIGFEITGPAVFLPGHVGSEIVSKPMRVDGLRLSPRWINDAIAAILEPDSAGDLRTLALLGSVLHIMDRILEGTEQARLTALEEFGNPRQLLADGSAAMAEGYPKLNPESRAWLLAVIPFGSGSLAPLLAIVQKDDHRLVRLSYLLYCLRSADDPMIDAAMRSGDPQLQFVAEMMQTRITQVEGEP